MSFENAPERFENKVKQSLRGCWTWTGATDRTGFGLFLTGLTKDNGARDQVFAHRWAYEYYNATPIPDGMQVKQTCGHRWCVAPHHLELVEG